MLQLIGLSICVIGFVACFHVALRAWQVFSAGAEEGPREFAWIVRLVALIGAAAMVVIAIMLLQADLSRALNH